MRSPEITLGLLLLGWLGACGAPQKGAATAQAAAPHRVERREELCADWHMTTHGVSCIRPLTPVEQQHRMLSFVRELEDGVPVGIRRINGRGSPVADDEGCIRYRYRYEGGYMVEAIGYDLDGQVCDRTLHRDHGKRADLVDEWGHPDFDNDRAYTSISYVRDAEGSVSSSKWLKSDGSPGTAHGTYETRSDRDANGLQKRFCYFDAAGKPTLSDEGIHCWNMQRDEFGNMTEGHGTDVQGQPIATSGGVYSRVLQHDAYGNLIREELFDLAGKPLERSVTLCPVEVFHYDEHGFRTGGDCLDAQGKLAAFEPGHSMWRSSPNARGYLRESRFFDQYGNPFGGNLGHARVEIDYDELGHQKERRNFLVSGEPGDDNEPPVTRFEYDRRGLETKRSFFWASGEAYADKGCSSQSREYNAQRHITRWTCLDADGQPTRDANNNEIMTYDYDARGLLRETRLVDEAGKLLDNDQGFARYLVDYDALGVAKKRHFSASGAAVSLGRFSVLWVRPPRSGGYYPAPSRSASLERIERAHRELLAGTPWSLTLQRYSRGHINEVAPGDTGYLALPRVYPAVRDAIAELKVGEYSEIVEIPYGFAVYLRTE